MNARCVQQQPFRHAARPGCSRVVACRAAGRWRQQQSGAAQQQLPGAAAAGLLSAAFLLAAPGASLAKMAPVNQEVDNADSPVIQGARQLSCPAAPARRARPDLRPLRPLRPRGHLAQQLQGASGGSASAGRATSWPTTPTPASPAAAAAAAAPAAMLKRTEEMREQRYKERLNDYYRRNFKVASRPLAGAPGQAPAPPRPALPASGGRRSSPAARPGLRFACPGNSPRCPTARPPTRPRLPARPGPPPQEYFDFEGGNASAGKARGLSQETQEAIAKWLEENK
jgi:hypothetical protein